MPHLHGFIKTLRFNLLMPVKVEEQASCTTTLYRKVVSYYLQVFQDHQNLIGHSRWLKMAENLTRRRKTIRIRSILLTKSFPTCLPASGKTPLLRPMARLWLGKPAMKSGKTRSANMKRETKGASAPGKSPPQYPEDNN